LKWEGGEITKDMVRVSLRGRRLKFEEKYDLEELGAGKEK